MIRLRARRRSLSGIVAEIDGLPAIFLPSLAPALDFDGVSVYADEPRVQDGTPARRSERLTLVFEAGGEFEGDKAAAGAHLPARELVLRMALEERVPDPVDLRGLFEESRDLESVLAVPLHAQRQGLETAVHEE